jgi:hypothetical protein
MASIPIAIPAINTLLKMASAGSPSTFTTIANIGDIAINMSGNVVDVTSHSTGSPWRQKLTTLLDAGDLPFKLFFVPQSSGAAGHDATNGLLSIFATRELRRFSITFPDDANPYVYFDATLSRFNIVATTAGVLEANVTLTITGEPQFT